MADVELLPLPEGAQIYGRDEMHAYARANIESLQAENERLRAEVSELRAARIAYANEFPATEDGDPDTGNIHANIRALKVRAERLRAEVDKRQALCEALTAALSSAEKSIERTRSLESARAELLAEALREARGRTADLSAWLKSGNDVPADLSFVFRERWQKIAADIRALEVALAQQPAGVGGTTTNSAVAAIQFALKDPEGMTFLRLWNEGEFDTLRREWPDAPVEVYIDADPLAAQQQEPRP